MNYTIECVTDVGISRKSNQDSAFYAVADHKGEKIACMVLCDGMGGYAKGEIASAELTKAFESWFYDQLPVMLQEGFSGEKLRTAWFALAESENDRLSAYARERGIKMGTTLTAALFVGGTYYVIHVGDCRLYELVGETLRQLTHDHTVTQQAIDKGELDPECAESDPRNHILLQCLGAGRSIYPDFLTGDVCPHSSFLLCSDGFRHKFSREEMTKSFLPDKNRTKQQQAQHLSKAIGEIKERGEKDNITACLLTVTA